MTANHEHNTIMLIPNCEVYNISFFFSTEKDTVVEFLNILPNVSRLVLPLAWDFHDMSINKKSNPNKKKNKSLEKKDLLTRTL